MERARLFDLAAELGAYGDMAEKVVAFAQVGMTALNADGQVASNSWFEWLEPLVCRDPQAFAMGLTVLSKYHTFLNKPAIAVKLLEKAIMVLEAEQEKAIRLLEAENNV
jgi:hypothetical protein